MEDKDFEVLVEGEKYRVTTLAILEDIETQKGRPAPIKDGLCVSQKLSNNDSFDVCLVTWNSEFNEPEICDIDFGHKRMIRNLLNEIKDPNSPMFYYYLNEYINCIEFAEQSLRDIMED